MKWIQILLGVVEKGPENAAANLALGKFSMQSGQYEKARDRFLMVINKKPGGEVYYYIGEAYRPLRDKKKAIEAYETTKRRSEEHTSELQSLLRITSAFFCLQTHNKPRRDTRTQHNTA